MAFLAVLLSEGRAAGVDFVRIPGRSADGLTRFIVYKIGPSERYLAGYVWDVTSVGYLREIVNGSLRFTPVRVTYDPIAREYWDIVPIGRPIVIPLGPAAVPSAPPRAAAVPANASGQGLAMSRDGTTVVGHYDNGAFTPYHAFRWTQSTDVVDLGTLDRPNNASRSSFATDVSSNGAVVVGYSDTVGGATWHAFRWTQAAGMVDLGAASGAAGFSRALALSGDGSVVAGESDFPGGFGTIRQAFRWTQAGGFQRLGSVQPDWPSVANAITTDGNVVVGNSGFPLQIGNTQSTTTRAFRWTQAGGMQNLGVLAGFQASLAKGVSDDGQIVVGACTSNTSSQAFYWSAATGLQPLAQLLSAAGVDLTGVTLTSANSITPDGRWISCEAIRPTTPAGETEPVLVSLTFTPVPQPASRIVNLAARAQTGSGADAIFCGFVISPGAEKTVLVRAVGPTLGTAPFNVPGALADPVLTLFGPDSNTLVAATNDNWNASAAATFSATGAFALPAGSRDAAIVARLAPGAYTAQVSGTGGATGVALVEVYDADPAASSRLINTAVRAQVGTGANVLIPGLVVSGSSPRTVLVRAIGPTLGAAPFNVPGTLAEPVVTLFSGAQSIATNRAWGTAANAAAIRDSARAVGAFAIPDGSRDSALLVTLAPGAYTIQVAGANNTTGVALVEVYEAP